MLKAVERCGQVGPLMSACHHTFISEGAVTPEGAAGTPGGISSRTIQGMAFTGCRSQWGHHMDQSAVDQCQLALSHAKCAAAPQVRRDRVVQIDRVQNLRLWTKCAPGCPSPSVLGT